MATYKVLQDIEAEDKLFGPFTLKQFIFISIAFVSAYLSFFLLTKHLWYIALIFLPVIFVSGFLGFPWGRDQPTEVWLLAKIRFLFKPRKRIWDQSGMQELVTITAPKNIAAQFVSDNLSQTEVRSRLHALADTIDSRGWAVKNVNVNMTDHVSPSFSMVSQNSDRLIDLSTFASQVPAVDVQASDDMLDEKNNPTAQHLSQMVQKSSTNLRNQTIQNLDELRDRVSDKTSGKSKSEPPADYWFMNTPTPSTTKPGYATFGTKTVLPGTTDDDNGMNLDDNDQALLDKIHSDEEKEDIPAYGHMKVVEPLHFKSKKKKHVKKAQAPMTRTPDPAILNLANNNDLNVATIARQANKKTDGELGQNEVVISLR